MSEQIGPYEIVERIDPDGYTLVYRAVEEMGHGIQRQAALKVLQGVKTDNEEAMSDLVREAGILLEVSTSPNIVTVYSFGVDEDRGPWIAMELAGQSLKHFTSESPADPTQVRLLLRDALQALSVVHEKGILHRDLKPNNILSTSFGQWKVADFGLARQQASEETMAMATVKYAAPEMLDRSLSAETQSLDLYSLGMLVYEFALGQALFRQQFPSIYDPDEPESKTDDRPKWMYWHTSTQMTVPPLADLLDDYPADLSALVSGLMAKQVPDRVPTARKGLELLGEVRAQIELEEEETDDPVAVSGSGSKVWAVAFFALVGLILFGAVAGYIYYSIQTTPVVSLSQENGRFESNKPTVPVTGTIENIPRGGRLQVKLEDGSTFPAIVDGKGRFDAAVRVKIPDEARAVLQIDMPRGPALELSSLTLIRGTPAMVRIEISTRPSTPNAEVTLTPLSTLEDLRTKTNMAGLASLDIPYGDFGVKVRHPCFAPISGTWHSGADESMPLEATMEPISESGAGRLIDRTLRGLPESAAKALDGDEAALADIARRREQLKCHRWGKNPAEDDLLRQISACLDEILDGHSGCWGTLAEITDDVMEIRAEADALPGAEADEALTEAEWKAEQLRKIREAIANGDTELAQRLIDEMKGRLDPDDPADAALLDQLGIAENALLSGDPNAALNAIGKAQDIVDEQIKQIKAARDGGAGGGEMTEAEWKAEQLRKIKEALANGDAAEAQRLIDEMKGRLDPNDPVDAALLAQLEKAEDAIASGDLEGAFQAINDAAAIQDAVMGRGGSGIPVGADGSLISQLDAAQLTTMSSEVLKILIELEVPSGAISVDVLPRRMMLRVRGLVFSNREHETLLQRLDPVMLRLEMEVRVDPWALCRRLSARYDSDGVSGVRVHAYLSDDEQLMYVVHPESIPSESVRKTAWEYVLDRDLPVTASGMPHADVPETEAG